MQRYSGKMRGLVGWIAAVVLVAGADVARGQLTITSRTNGNWNATNTWDSGTVPTGADTVTIAAAHTVTNSVSTQYAVSNLTINGVLTHGLNMKVDLLIGGNLTIDAGGMIDVTGKSSDATNAGVRHGRGASHGGLGGSGGAGGALTYGSITNPVTLGSRGNQTTYYGGGVVILRVEGQVVLNGRIRADVLDVSLSNESAGAGGSINLTTGTLTGTGTNSVNGGNLLNTASARGGGGGRIAVRLTAGDSFGDVVMQAHGGYSLQAGQNAAAGTIYLETASQAALGQGYGSLLIDNRGTNTPAHTTTHLATSIDGRSVGNVHVRNGGRLALADDTTLVLRGDLTNDSHTETFGGTIIVDGTGTSTFSGSVVTNIFRNLTCTNANKQLTFQAGTLYDVTGILKMQGDTIDNPVVLRSSVAGTQWRLKIGVNEHTVLSVDAQDSDAREGLQVGAVDSVNSGNNSNWIFSVSGATNTWEGTEDTDWGNSANWSFGWQPIIGEAVLIPDGQPRYPVLDAIKILDRVTIDDGASIDLAGYDLTVRESLVVSGAVSAVHGEIVSVQGDADLTGGTITWGADAVFKLTGTGHQTLTVDGDTFNQLTIENATGTNTFVGSFSATNMTCRVPGAVLVFGAGSTYTVGDLALHGTDTTPITLRSSTPGTAWNLVVTGRSRVGGVHVTDSDADTGLTIYPVMSVNGGRNENWVFGADTWKRWTGASSAVFATAGNWSPSGTPDATHRIWIDGNHVNAPSLNAGITVTQMVVGGSAPATLTHNTTAALTVLGDVEIWNEAVVTHVLNADHSKYVNMVIGGSLSLDAGGEINVSGRSIDTTSIGGVNGGFGASHGGAGWSANAGAAAVRVTYGSITNPVTLGSRGSNADSPGGGVVILNVGGHTLLNGVIRSDASSSVSIQRGFGAGGSVNLTSGLLAGSGMIAANGGGSLGNSLICGGGGGRIAVRLTASNSFGNVSIMARGGEVPNLNTERSGAAGTIYLETADQAAIGPGNGTLIINNDNIITPTYTVSDMTTNVTDSVFGDLVVTNASRLHVGADREIELRGSLLNTATHVSHADSAWTFAGANAVLISGDNTFGNLSIGCDPPDIKEVTFENGKTQTVLGDLRIARARLRSTSDGDWWYLTLDETTGTQSLIQSVNVKDSNAGLGQEIEVTATGTDAGNNLNWLFPPSGTLFMLR